MAADAVTARDNSSKRSAPDPIARLLANDMARLRVEARFWPKVMKPGNWEACWPWIASTGGDGKYGKIKVRPWGELRAHRLSYAFYHNRSPGELCVCHHCDNPSCVNPLHLFLGTHKDNSDDKIAKGRARPADNRGESNGNAKLSAADVVVVRELILAGLNNTRIAERFGVTHQLISRIRRGRSWGAPAMMDKYQGLRRKVA